MYRLLALFAILPAIAFGADPRFSSISPTAVQRGQEVEVDVRGDRLSDLVDIVTNDGGIELVKITPNEKDANRRASLTLKIAADAGLGLHHLRLRTKSGLSELRNLHVTDVPVVLEVEKKTGIEDAQPIELNSAVVGRIDREDVDYYKVSLKKGQRISAEVIGTRMGNSSGSNYFDPYLALLDSKRFELAISDDEALTANDSYFSVAAPEDGEYFIELRDSAYHGDGNAHYALHIGTFPRPSGISPVGGKAGETVEVTLLGDPAGEKKVSVKLPDTPGDFEFFPSDDQGIAPTPHIMKVTEWPAVAEVEPNNDPWTQGTPAVLPAGLQGVLGTNDDYDNFKFTAKKGQRFSFTAIGRTARSPIDPVIHVFDIKNKKTVGGSDDIGNNPDGRYDFTAPADGEYAVRIYDHLKRGGPEYVYRIEAEVQTPHMTADVIEMARYVQPRWVAPAGGGIARRIAVSRKNFGGQVKPVFENLPKGVRVEMPEVWSGSGQVPVVLYVDESAEPSHTFTKMGLAKADDPNVTGHITQNILQVRWNNNNRVIAHHFDELPVVVTEKAPFQVWLEEPTTPAVPNGWVDVVARCERAEGFNEEIRFEMLMNPPGCSTSRSLKFEKDKDRVVMRITAGDKAASGRWDVCVRAWANHNGTLETCSPFTPVHVQDRWVDFTFQQAAVERGQTTQMVIEVKHNESYEGEATVKLLGLPPKTTAEPVKMKAGDTQVTFEVKTEEGTPAGTHKSVYCIAEIPVQVGMEPGETVEVALIEDAPKDGEAASAEKPADGEKPAEPKPAAQPEPKPIIEIVSHQFRGGRLRVDNPLPPKKDAPKKPEPKKVEKPKEAPKKPLSRLEMLRQQKGM